jgi:UDP-N-acetyl-2-amino-2-deoxyglucuronate dehydrogenase
MKQFALIGAAGYIAPRHMQAIKDTGHNLAAALDRHDAAGVLDNYFPDCAFFTEFERFDRHCDKLRRSGNPLHYVSVCSPNYLHDAHIRFGLRSGADVICEKPLVLNHWNIDGLTGLEQETGRRVYCILQLRLHPAIVALRQKIMAGPAGHVHKVNLRYITPRGQWYHTSWKGETAKSGGIATNIGIHFFDLLQWLFGTVAGSRVIAQNHQTATGTLVQERAQVNWLVSIDRHEMPDHLLAAGKNSFRWLEIDGESIDFSEGFGNLHTRSYEEILRGNGFSIADARPAIEMVQHIRNS